MVVDFAILGTYLSYDNPLKAILTAIPLEFGKTCGPEDIRIGRFSSPRLSQVPMIARPKPGMLQEVGFQEIF